jgi:hypothetical protein
MSKENRTQTQLLSNIQSEWAWRIKELDDIKSAIRKSKGTTSHESLLRAGIPILYAHWEGFVKSASYHYFNYVTTKGYRLSELSDNFVAISLRRMLNELSESTKFTLHKNAVDFFRNQMDTRARFPGELPLRTSNLKFDILQEYCCLVGLDHTKFELRKHFIDQRLVGNRNNIAHGKWLLIDLSDFIEIYDLTLETMSWFKDGILDAVGQELFRTK